MADNGEGDGWWLASDGKYYPPTQEPDYSDHPPPQRNRKRVVFLGAAAVGVVFVIGVMSGFAVMAFGSDSSEPTNSEPATESATEEPAPPAQNAAATDPTSTTADKEPEPTSTPSPTPRPTPEPTPDPFEGLTGFQRDLVETLVEKQGPEILDIAATCTAGRFDFDADFAEDMQAGGRCLAEGQRDEEFPQGGPLWGICVDAFMVGFGGGI